MSEPRWRIGRKVGRTVYMDGALVGVMDTPALAAQVVQALNTAPKCATCAGGGTMPADLLPILAAGRTGEIPCPNPGCHHGASK